MGQVTSVVSAPASYVYNWYWPVLPPAISAEQIANGVGSVQLVTDLKQRSYAIIRPTAATTSSVVDMIDRVSTFFNLSKEEKSLYEVSHSSDPLLHGKRSNRGYSLVKSTEFFKSRMNDEPEVYPSNPEDLQPKVKDAVKELYDLAISILYAVGGTKIDTHTSKTLMDKSTLSSLIPFLQNGFSISVIKYFEKDNTSAEEHEPLEEHVDGGIITLVRVGDVPGLQVYDIIHGWIEIEKLATKNDYVLLLGMKVSLLTDESVMFEPTKHRVVKSKNKIRISVLGIMDILNDNEEQY